MVNKNPAFGAGFWGEYHSPLNLSLFFRASFGAAAASYSVLVSSGSTRGRGFERQKALFPKAPGSTTRQKKSTNRMTTVRPFIRISSLVVAEHVSAALYGCGGKGPRRLFNRARSVCQFNGILYEARYGERPHAAGDGGDERCFF